VAKRATNDENKTFDRERLEQVAWLVRKGKTGPTVAEIVAANEAGLLTGQEAIDGLERDFAESARYRQEREQPIGEWAEDAIVAPDDTEKEVVDAESRRELDAIIDQLTEWQATCVKLYHLEGYSQREISERLGINQQMVARHLAAGRKKLAVIMREMVVKVPSRAVLSDAQNSLPTYEDLMAEPEDEEKRSVPLLFPFELWLRHNEGARWNRYGVYRPVIKNRLPEYLAACFDIPPVVGFWQSPRSSKKSSPADGINRAERQP